MNNTTLPINRAHPGLAAADVSPRTPNQEEVSADSRRRLPFAFGRASRWLTAGAALGLLLSSAKFAQAETTAVSNLANFNPDAVGPVGFFSSGTPADDYSVSYAQTFTTGSDAVTLSRVTLEMATRFSMIDGGGFTVSLHSDSAGSPGALLAVLSGDDTPNVAGPYIYIAPAGTALTAATTYWILASVPQEAPNKSYYWQATYDLSETGLPGWSMGKFGLLQLFGGVGSWRFSDVAALKMAVNIVDDTDGDGVPDDEDECPNSLDVGSTIKIGGTDTGVPNVVFENGCTISDMIADLADGAKNHGQFVRGVAALKNALREEGILTAEEAEALQSAAAESSLP